MNHQAIQLGLAQVSRDVLVNPKRIAAVRSVRAQGVMDEEVHLYMQGFESPFVIKDELNNVLGYLSGNMTYGEDA